MVQILLFCLPGGEDLLLIFVGWLLLGSADWRVEIGALFHLI